MSGDLDHGRGEIRIDQRLNLCGPAHPWLGPDGFHPVGEARDEAEVFLHMLLANPAGRDDAPGREREGRPQDRLGHEDALGVVAQRPVPEVRCDLLALVEPGMHRHEIVDGAAPFLHRGQRVVVATVFQGTAEA